MENSSHRIAQIDYVKALGIILVIIGHVVQFTENDSSHTKWISAFIYSFHMPLFFFLTGIEIGLKDEPVPFGTMLQKSIQRLLIPYFVWSAIYIFLNILFHMERWKGILLERSYAMLTGRGIAPLWFLLALFLCRIIMYPLLKSFRGPYRFEKECVFIVTSGCLSVIIHPLFMKLTGVNNLILYPLITIFRIVPSVFFVAVGHITAGTLCTSGGRNPLTIVQRICLLAAGLGLLCLLPSYNRVNMHLFDFRSMPLFLLTGVLGSCSMVLLCGLLPEKISLLLDIGRRSMDIMVLHYPPIYTIKAVVILFHLFGINPPFIVISAVVLVVTHFMSALLLEPAKKKVRQVFALRNGGN